MINNVFVSMAVLSEVLVAACDKFSRWPYWIEYGGKVDAFIGSENTYAKIDAARFAGRRNKFRRRWNGHPSRKHARGFVGNPSGRRQRCRVRHRLGRLLVDVTYKSGTK